MPEDWRRLRKLPALRTLILTDNELAELPAHLGELSTLELLVLSGNRLTRLPDLSELRALRTLILTGNPLAAGEVERVRAALQDCPVVY